MVQRGLGWAIRVMSGSGELRPAAASGIGSECLRLGGRLGRGDGEGLRRLAGRVF